MASDSPILDEILAEQGKPSTCQVCLWLLAQPPADRAQWEAALADRTYQASAIFRAIAKRLGPDSLIRPTRGSVENHRANKHVPKPR